MTFLTARTGRAGLESLAARRPDAIVLDVDLPDMSGVEAFVALRRAGADVPVIVVAGEGSPEVAIEAIRLGAYDCLTDPLRAEDLLDRLGRALEAGRPRGEASRPTPPGGRREDDALIGKCPAMQEVYKAIGRASRQDVTVLILGESGTGKELVARALHRHGRRSGGPFLPINCAAIPEALLESELFGHERGAFTGADSRRIGTFERCSRGVLFLDEVGDMTPMTQAKVLRVVQDQRFERVGGHETIQADVQLIAATNRDLRAMIRAGDFRGDLFYRLNVFTIELPPLRERGGDVRILAEAFVERFSRGFDAAPRRVSDGVFSILEEYAWPGNLRELQGVLKQAVIQSRGQVLMPEDLPAYLRKPGKAGRGAAAPPAPTPAPAPAEERGPSDWEGFIRGRIQGGSKNLYAESLAFVERELITGVLRRTDGNQVHAARILGITRGSLRHKIRALGITITQVVTGAEEPSSGDLPVFPAGPPCPPADPEDVPGHDAASGRHPAFAAAPQRTRSWTPSPIGNAL